MKTVRRRILIGVGCLSAFLVLLVLGYFALLFVYLPDWTLSFFRSDPRELLTLNGDSGPLMKVAFDPRAGQLAAASWDGGVLVWDFPGGRNLKKLPELSGWACGLAYSSAGNLLAAGSRKGTIFVWDTLTGRQVLRLEGSPGPVWSLAFDPQGKRLVSASSNYEFDFGGKDDPRKKTEYATVWLWNLADGSHVALVDQYPLMIRCVDFSPTGSAIAAGTGDWKDGGPILLWDLTVGNTPRELKGHTKAIQGVAFSHDGRELVSCSRDRTARIWDVATGNSLLSFDRHNDIVQVAKFSRDGNLVASASIREMLGEIKVWDAHTGAELFTMKGHRWRSLLGAQTEPHCDIAFTPDGTRLASCREDGLVKIWDVKPSEVNK